MASSHSSLASLRSLLLPTAALCLPFRTQHASVYVARAALIPSMQPARTKMQRFGGFTSDKYAVEKRRRARERLIASRRKPMASQAQISRGMERPLTVASIGSLILPTAPLERSQRASVFSRRGWSHRWTALRESLTNLYSVAMIRRKLRSVDPFRPVEFARRAQDMFVSTNAALQQRDKSTLRRLTTENALEILKREFDNKAFTWSLLEELERPRVVAARLAPYMDKGNLFAQVVVRIRSSQVMAVYDKAGRLLHGHPVAPRDVVDYVVLERHIVNPKSTWRVAGKLPPNTSPQRTVQGGTKALTTAS